MFRRPFYKKSIKAKRKAIKKLAEKPKLVKFKGIIGAVSFRKRGFYPSKKVFSYKWWDTVEKHARFDPKLAVYFIKILKKWEAQGVAGVQYKHHYRAIVKAKSYDPFTLEGAVKRVFKSAINVMSIDKAVSKLMECTALTEKERRTLLEQLTSQKPI